MNEKDAKKLAHGFLCQYIALDYCFDPPQGLYAFDPAEEFLFTFRLFGAWAIGSSEYVAVSKTTGAVGYLGHHGE